MQQHSSNSTPPLTPRSRASSMSNNNNINISTRRTATHHGCGGGGDDDSSTSTSSPSSSLDDDSKTKKLINANSAISLAVTRTLNYLTSLRANNNNALWGPFVLLGLALVLVLVLILIVLTMVVYSSSRDVVCVSSYGDGVSRVNFFGFDGLDSDFAALGVPWCRSKRGKTVEWTSKDLIRGLEEFLPIYETRPIKNNMYGMGFDHSFGLWFIARMLKPDCMIESGAFKGHSTWVLRQAMPDTRIISVTPRHPEKYLKKGPAYVDGNCTYYAGKDFVDFGSMDWGKVMKKHGITNLDRVLVFFDDHQNELKRVKQALKAGFRHLVFEDNYDTGSGDHYSLRQICDQFYIRGGGHSCFRDSDEARMRAKRKKFWEKAVDIDELCGPDEAWWGVRGEMRDNFNHSNKPITYVEHFQNSRFVESVLDVYWELPPVAGPSLTHQSRYDPARTRSPIVQDGQYGLFQRLGLARLENSVFNGYTQMVYIQISPPGS